MTSDNASPGATTVAELASDLPTPALAALGADPVASWATSSMWVSINGSPAGDWDGPSGRVSSVLNVAKATLTRERRTGAGTVDLGSDH